MNVQPPLVPPYLQPIQPTQALTAGNFGRVAGFTCNKVGAPERPWERDVREWITDPGPKGALYFVQNQLGDVWLYDDPMGQLVGYGSLDEQKVVAENGQVLGTVYTIPFFAIHSTFRGQPPGNPQLFYARRIFGGLVEEAERRGNHPWLYLWVDPQNPARVGFYPEFGFTEYKADYDKVDGRWWIIMHRPIP